MIPWLLISILAILIIVIILAVLIAFKNKGKRQEPDYYALFIMGITWIPLGIVFMATGNTAFSFFFILGLVYMAIGLAHKDQWRKNHKTWNQLSKGERNFKLILLLILGILVLGGLVAFLMISYILVVTTNDKFINRIFL